jgi:uncharacterized protein (TIGR02118 family)
MIHVHYFITRKPSLSDAEFHRYWREVHGPIAKRIPQLRTYIQSHRIPFTADILNSPYDGAAEVWLDNEAALEQLRKEDAYLKGALADEPNFIDMKRVEWQVTEDHVILDAPRTPSMIKVMWRLRRKDGMTVADFKDYWLNVHAPIALHLPGMRRYVQCHAVAGAYGFGEPRWDGVAQTWFDDTDSLRRMLDSDEFKLRDMPDGEKFIGTLEVLVVREHDVI